jgi:hypothetical protein
MKIKWPLSLIIFTTNVRIKNLFHFHFIKFGGRSILFINQCHLYHFSFFPFWEEKKIGWSLDFFCYRYGKEKEKKCLFCNKIVNYLMLSPKSKTKKPLSLPLSYLGRMFIIFFLTLFDVIFQKEHNNFFYFKNILNNNSNMWNTYGREI